MEDQQHVGLKGLKKSSVLNGESFRNFKWSLKLSK